MNKTFLFFALSLLFLSCTDSGTNPIIYHDPMYRTFPYPYRCNMCGDIYLKYKIGSDITTSLDSLKHMKAPIYGNKIQLKYNALSDCKAVNDSLNKLKLYMVCIYDSTGENQIQSCDDIIDSVGNLYQIHWCPD